MKSSSIQAFEKEMIENSFIFDLSCGIECKKKKKCCKKYKKKGKACKSCPKM